MTSRGSDRVDAVCPTCSRVYQIVRGWTGKGELFCSYCGVDAPPLAGPPKLKVVDP